MISIGYASSFSPDQGVLVRKNMTEQGAEELIQKFLTVLENLRVKHYQSLPEAVKEYFKTIKCRMKAAASVKEKTELATNFRYLQNISTLKVLGFNSGKYDLPCLLNRILALIDLKDVHVIKRGETIFSLSFNGLSFRDCMNYSGPMSLDKFASIFKLPISKGIFPYEKFQSAAEMENFKHWPSYKDFWSSLPCFHKDHFREINEILQLPIIYKINSFGEFLDTFGIDFEVSATERNSPFSPDLTDERKLDLNKKLPLSPKLYFEQKFEFESRIESGEFSSFLDHLKHYNLLDCQLLTEAMKRFLEIFDECFDICLFERLSLPAISESIMWNSYDKNCPKMFSFDAKYGFLNEKIREKLQGGPTILFHRHAEVLFPVLCFY